MIGFATLNIQGGGSAKVHWLADLFLDDEFPVDVLAVQELNLEVLSTASFVAILKDRGLHVFLSAEDNGVYRCAVLARFPGVAVGMCSGRLAMACFEFLCHGSFCKVVVASYYGLVWDSEVAMQGALDAVAQLRATRAVWVLLGDFNLEPSLEPLATNLARGFAVPWDADFETTERLPGTRESGRRVDFAVGCGTLAPTGLRQRWVFSDHAQVAYDVDLGSPAGFGGPAFGALAGDPVSEEAWMRRWQAASFDAAVAAGDVNTAWTLLSDCAEDLLRDPAAVGGCRRTALWRPRARLHPRSKAGRTKDPLVVVRLRRLERRLRQLAREPGFQRLRDKAAKLLEDLLGDCPWLRSVPYFEMEHWADFVAEHLDRVEGDRKEMALKVWRERMAESESRVLTWIRRRETLKVELDRPALAPEAVHRCSAVHPVRVVEEAEASWMRLWGRAETTGRVPALLSALPSLPEASWTPTFSAEALLKAGKAMASKAAGPDGWTTGHWCLLPMAFWEALAVLWAKVVNLGMVPELWRRGRVVLIPKPVAGYRPLTILSCAWRVGARFLVGQLAEWIDSWASHRVLGGVHSRGVRDSFLRILDSFDTDQLYVQEDLTKFFDGIRHADLQASLAQLGAPRALCALLRDFQQGHSRVFTHNGGYGSSWHHVRCGVPQGCPLSPMLAGVVMALWSQHVEAGGDGAVQTASFVDDRLVWASAPSVLAGAMSRSSGFDSAYGFNCDVAKCRFVGRAFSPEARALAASLGYVEADRLATLGLVIPLDCAEAPTLRGFDLEKARRRIRLIAVAVQGLPAKRRFLSMLVLPMVTWAGGYGTIPARDLEALIAEFRWLLHKDLAADSPPVLTYEVMGWEQHPGFAKDLAALRCAVGLQCRVPVWVDEASVRLAGKRWPALLPVTRDILEDLGWWCDLRGYFVYRRDSYGQVRSFEVGVDSLEVVTSWLRDVYRRRGLQRCGRVTRALHRDEEPDLAQGLVLPGPPPGCLATFEGHRWAWRSAADTLERRSALVTGCSVWHKQRKLPRWREAPSCLCSRRLPSRAHLLWNCPSTRDLVQGVQAPANRLQERLLAYEVPEVPGPPRAVDPDDLLEALAEALEVKLAAGGPVFVATDGSLVDTVAAWAVALDGDLAFSQTVTGEDQSAHRAEVDGLVALALALGRCRSPGEVHVIADCQAALLTVAGGGGTPLLSSRAAQAFAALPQHLQLHKWWVPSHGKLAPARWRPPPCGEMLARALNHKADRAARDRAVRAAAGSLRQQCCQARAKAFEWEQAAHRALRQVARRWEKA